jgi:hypothetical protein
MLENDLKKLINKLENILIKDKRFIKNEDNLYYKKIKKIYKKSLYNNNDYSNLFYLVNEQQEQLKQHDKISKKTLNIKSDLNILNKINILNNNISNIRNIIKNI